MLTQFVENVALLVALCLVQRLVARRWAPEARAGQVAAGALFGVIAAASIASAVEWSPGVVFDARAAVLGTAALFGGPVTGVVAGGVAGAYRAWLGGPGAAVGVGTIVSAVLLGLALRDHPRFRPATVSAGALAAFGLLVAGATVAWFALLPLRFVDDVLVGLAPVYVPALCAATLGVGLQLREVELGRATERALEASERRFEALFDAAAVAFIEEDLSELFDRVARLRAEGVVDLAAHLERNPGLAGELLATLRITRANPAAVALFEAGSREELVRRFAETSAPSTVVGFSRALCSLWAGDARFLVEAEFRTLRGRTFLGLLSAPPPATAEAARRVPITIADVTELRRAERALDLERERLQEVLRATRAGTWTWDVATGAFSPDEGWARLAGYPLEALVPATIETWRRLTHPDDLPRAEAALARVLAREDDLYDCERRQRHADGRWVWVHGRGSVVAWGADGAALRVSGTTIDVTARRQAEARADRLGAIRETVLRCHTALLAPGDEPALLQALADLLVENRGHDLVWLGVPEGGPERRVVPVARAGVAADYVDGLDVRWGEDDPRGQGPTGTAIRTGLPQVARDLASRPDYAPWASAAEGQGLRSSAAVPVGAPGRVLATINVYSHELEHFDADELALLGELGANLGLVLEARRAEEARAAAGAALERAYLVVVDAVVATIERRDPYTSGHQRRVARLAVAIAQGLGWPPARVEGLRLGALVHDIGKIAVPAEILARPGRLNAAEFALVREHAAAGAEIMAQVALPWPIRDMIAQHHERLDGSGYPLGLSGAAICEEARVIAVADVLESIASHRPYRPALGVDEGLAELARGRGTLFDPDAVDACARVVAARLAAGADPFGDEAAAPAPDAGPRQGPGAGPAEDAADDRAAGSEATAPEHRGAGAT